MKTFPLNLTPLQKERLHLALEAHKEFYNPAERMLREPLPANATYHTTLKSGWIHPTYRSLVYAVALLDSGVEANLSRAADILDRLVGLQDANPESPTYGIWSWFMDEPLEKMSPPDWNFADFCGGQLVEAILTHRHHLDPGLVQRIDAAIIHAGHSIKRRNVSPDYTNIAIMGSFVCTVAGELLGNSELQDYGLTRFRTFYDYTMQQGAFTEYNSPTYTFIALNELSRIRAYVQDETARRLAGEIYRRGWEEISTHFHAPTRQWAGPHSRAYSVFLTPELQSFLHRATGASFPEIDGTPALYEHRIMHQCPEDLRPHFFSLEKPCTFREVFSTSGDLEIVGTTVLNPDFTLGTVNAGDLWNQRRALVAYWGTAEAPKYLHLRCLHDGYDFSAANIFTSQQEGDVLAGIAFAHDQGDTHLCLDMIQNSTIRAEDVRIRLELGGVKPLHNYFVTEHGVSAFLDGVHLEVETPWAFWDGTPARWEVGGEGETPWIDLVLYHGSRQEFHLPSLSRAAAVITLRLSVDRPLAKIGWDLEQLDDTLHVKWGEHTLTLRDSPATLAELRSTCLATQTLPLIQVASH